MTAHASDLWRHSNSDRYIILLPLRTGMSFEAAARRAHELVLAGHQGLGDSFCAPDTQLTLESNPGARWRLYGDSISSVSEALRRIETRPGANIGEVAGHG